MDNIFLQSHKITKADRARSIFQKPFIVWLTGLSGSGKSTLAGRIDEELFGLGYHSYLLDGDNVRHGINSDLGFSSADRAENIRRVGEVSKLMIDAGLIVITAFISPFLAERSLVRRMVDQDEFVEVYLDTPLDVCEVRDPKGLYKKARNGEIRDFTGLDSPYETPESPELIISAANLTVEQELEIVMSYLHKHLYLVKE